MHGGEIPWHDGEEENTYGEPDIAPVGNEKNKTAYARVVARIGSGEERDGDKVMGHHLDVVFAALFGVEN